MQHQDKTHRIHFGKIVKNGGLFLLLTGLTYYFVFRETDSKKIGSALQQVNLAWLVLGLVCMGGFVLFQGSNISQILRLFGYRVSLLRGMKYSMIGFFFSSVTPSSSGGQPMQMYYMHKDRIEFSHSALALLIELASYQTVAVTLSVAGFALQYRTLRESAGAITWLVFAGVLLNCLWLTVLLLCIFTKWAATLFAGFLMRVTRIFHFKKAEAFCARLTEQMVEYHKCVGYFRKNRMAMLRVVLTSCGQMLAWHSVPYWVYRAFGLSGFSAVSIIAMQAVLYITGSALPFPGGVGISESGFLILFRTLFPAALLDSAMLLSRGVSFYLPLIVNGISVAVFSLIGGRTTARLPGQMPEDNPPQDQRNVS